MAGGATIVHGASGEAEDRAITLTLPPGDVGTDATCMAMRACAEDAAENSRGVEVLATTLAAGGFLPRELYAWLRAHVKFKRDSRGLEHVRHPDVLLAAISRDGITEVDCDCLATLACAVLLRSRAFCPCLVVAGKHAAPAEFQHVFYATRDFTHMPWPWKLGDNHTPPGFTPYDPQERTPPGQLPPGIKRLRVYPF